MRERLRTIATCMLFVVLFGGIGAFTGWLAGTTLIDGYRAREWVKVRAEVLPNGAYRYDYDGRSRVGTRLGLMPLGSDDVDGWTAGIVEAMESARSENRPITVYVNPGDPDEALVNREIHWKFVAGMTPFVFGFGGVGAGALWIMGRNALAMLPGARRRASAESLGPLAKLWLMTFFWNVISIPLTMVALPDLIADGKWAGLMILLFPAVGAVLLYGAVMGTWKRVREGAGMPDSVARRGGAS